MGMAQREAQRVLDSKLKYWSKVLSEQAWNTNLWVMFNTFDWNTFQFDFVLSESLFSSLVSLIFYDVPLPKMPMWALQFDVELPTAEEFKKGVLIKLINIDLAKSLAEWLRLPPEQEDWYRDIFKDVEKTIELIFADEVASGLKKSHIKKGIYGEARYGYSYYDPPAVAEFIRSSVYAWFARKSFNEAKERFEKISKDLNIHPAIAEDLFNRLSMVYHSKYKCPTWDYGWWDVSDWCTEEEGKGKLSFVTFSMTEAKVDYETLYDAQSGGYWDLSFWDMANWEPPNVEKKIIYRVNPELSDTYLSILRDAVFVNYRSRLIATATAIANYQKREEMRKPLKSSRTETYALPYSMRARLESLTESIVTSLVKGIDSFTLRLYKTAVLDLFGSLTKQHGWGSEAVKSMTDDEVKKFWLDKWEAEGLDRNVLEKIFNIVYRQVKTYGSVRTRDRLRFLMYKLSKGR